MVRWLAIFTAKNSTISHLRKRSRGRV
jgi:hypothetical protein